MREKRKDFATFAHIFESAAAPLLAHTGEKRTEEGRDRRAALTDVYSCSEAAEVLERASKQRMAPCPAWPSPLARLSVFGL